MKKKISIFCAVCTLFFILALESCSDLISDTSDTTETTDTTNDTNTPKNQDNHDQGNGSTGTVTTVDETTASDSDTWDYTTASPVYTLDASTLSVAVSGDDLAGKTVYMARVNPTDDDISSSYVRYVASSDGFETDLSCSGPSSSSSNSGGRSCSVDLSADTLTDNSSGIKNFIPPQTFSKNPSLSRSASRSSSSTSTIDRSESQIDRTVGTTKDIYVDQDTDVSTFASESATLYYAGTYCNVWIVDDYYADTASGKYVNSSVAESVGKDFDDVYPMVKNIYGDESDDIYYSYSSSSGFTEDDLEKLSDTGYYTDDDNNTVNYVNIVLYDIGADHDEGDTSGIVGYFYAKDYYPDADDLSTLTGYSYSSSSALNYSNEGKYFYVDTYYANEYFDTVRSTLPHEFQHMIDWGVKDMDYGLSPSTWYNEMMSMLCEDMMQNYLDIGDEDSPKNRLPYFNEYYYLNGLEFNENSTAYTLISYATSYAFGAWLTRQFGGATLVNAMAQNEAVDTDSVVDAVNSVNDTDYTIADILKMYAEACVFNTDDDSYTYPTFNQTQELTSGDDLYYSDETYGYPLAAIDLWDSAYGWTDSDDDTETGPQLFDNDDFSTLEPYGFTLHELGTVADDTTELDLTFNSTSASDEDVYLFIQ